MGVQTTSFEVGQTSIPDNVGIVLMPSQSNVYLPDVEVLDNWLRSNVPNNTRCLVWNDITVDQFTTTIYSMIGAAAADFRSPLSSTFSIFGQEWIFHNYISSVHIQFQDNEAKVRAVDDREIAAVLSNNWGNGTVVYASVSVELEIGSSDDPKWQQWYQGELGLCVS